MDKNKVKVLEGQSLLDVAIQTSGTVEAAIDMATINGMSITDDLECMELRTVSIVNRLVQQYYEKRAIKPATAITEKGQIFEDVFNEVFA